MTKRVLGPSMALTVSLGWCFSVLLLVVLCMRIAYGDELTVNTYVSPSNLPTPRTGKPTQIYYGFLCYDGDTYPRTLMSCEFKMDIVGLAQPFDDPVNNGGHFHDYASHPLTFPAGLGPIYQRAIYPVGSVINGYTPASADEIDADLIYLQAPEVAGTLDIESAIYFPGFPYLLFSPEVTYFHDFMHVQIPDKLVELPPSSFYIRCGLTTGCLTDSPALDPSHPQEQFGEPELINDIIGLAAMYRSDYPTETLRISDISLPYGGLFDTSYSSRTVPFVPPHQSHRLGVSVDISHYVYPGGVLTFVDQLELDKIIRRRGLSRLSEYTNQECPDLKPGEPPCIHIDLPSGS